jgi:nucleoside-diphosphate-sugar epimerase
VTSPEPSHPVTALVARSRRLLAGRVLVTGATGFIGANIVRALLNQGSEVHVIVRPSSATWRLNDVLVHVETHVASLTDAKALYTAFAGARPAVVLHLATPRGHDEDARVRIREATHTGASHLLRLVREFGVARLIAAGSSLEYRPADAPLTEDAPIEPITLHGSAKAAASELYQRAARETGAPVTVLRLFHVYGPWESRHRLLPTAIHAALAGTPLPLTAGGIARDWVFVGDVVDAMLRAVGLRRGGDVINVGSGQEYSNEAVIACVADTLRRPIRIVAGAFPRGVADAAHRCADRSKASRLLGWTPKVTLSDGVRRTCEWFEKNPSAWTAAGDQHPTAV